MSKIMITGSSGFIGTNLMQKFLDDGDEVLGLDIAMPKNKKHLACWRNISIMNVVDLNKIIKEFKPEKIVHLGARTDLNGTGIADYLENHQGTANVLAAASNCNSVKRVIVASSRLVNEIGYEPKNYNDYNPTTPYGESKVLTEKVVREFSGNFSITVVRPTSIWGPWFGIPYRNFFDSVISGRYMHPAGQRIRKNFGYVGNSVFQLQKLLEASTADVDKKTFYLTDYEPIEVFDFAQKISSEAKVSGVKEVPFFFLKFASKIGDLMMKVGVNNPPLTTFRLNNLMTNMLYKTDDIYRVVGPLPYSLKDGVVKTFFWMNGSGKD